jgi:hypothetical protein
MEQFKIVGASLAGRGLTFDVTLFVPPTGENEDPSERSERMDRLAEIAETAYREGRASLLLSWDERFDLHGAVDVLRSLAVIVGPIPTGDRHRRMADIISRLLQDQEGGS